MKMTRSSPCSDRDSKSREITFTTLPSASAIHPGSFGSCWMRRSESHRFLSGLSATKGRIPSIGYNDRIRPIPAAFAPRK